MYVHKYILIYSIQILVLKKKKTILDYINLSNNGI